MKINLFVLAIVISLTAGTAASFNFGSNLRTGNIEINESGCFEILVWTADEKDLNVIFSVYEKPQSWKVDVIPERISINSTTGSEIILLHSGYSRASVVKICAYPSHGSNGTYQIKAKASAYSGSEEMQSTQDRFFNLFANATGNYKEEKPDNYLAAKYLVALSAFVLILLAARRFLK